MNQNYMDQINFFEKVVRWVVACVRSLGCDPEDLDLVEGLDVACAALLSFPPRICSLGDFFPELAPRGKPDRNENFKGVVYHPEERYPFGSDGLGSAEYFEQLARAGFAERG